MLTHSNHVHSESRTKQCGRRPWARGAECTPECNNPHHKHRLTPHSWFFPSSGSFPEWVIARVLRQRPLYSRHGHTCQTHLRTPSSLSHHRQNHALRLPPPHTHTPPCLSLRVPLGLRKGEVPRRLAGRPPLARPCHSTPDQCPLMVTASFPNHLFPLPGRPFSRPQALLFLSPPLSSPHLISPPQQSLSPSLTTTLSQLYGLWALMS